MAASKKKYFEITVILYSEKRNFSFKKREIKGGINFRFLEGIFMFIEKV